MRRSFISLFGVLLLTAGALGHGTDEEVLSWSDAMRDSDRLRSEGRAAEAELILLQALRAGKELSHDALANLYNDLGAICQDQVHVVPAHQYYRKAINEWEKASGPKRRLGLALTENNLASLLWETGRPKEAEALTLRASQTLLEVLGIHTPDNQVLLMNLGLIHIRQRNLSEAERVFRLVDGSGSEGEDALQAAAVANYLGAIRKRRGQNTEAEVEFQRANRIWRRAQGRAPAEALGSLMMSYVFAERYEESLEVMQRAIPAMSEGYGPNHPMTGQAMMECASVLRKLKRKEEARQMEKQAKAIQAASGRSARGVTVSLSDLLNARSIRRGKRAQ